jgi:hypothetical protein
MRNLGCVSVLLPFLLAFTLASPLRAETGALRLTKTDEKAFAWCLSHFPFGLENPWAEEDAVLPARPVERLSPLDTKVMLIPPGLVTDTEAVGKLPSAVARYKGLWIWPTVSVPSPMAIFVEQLTTTEMTIAMIRKKLPSNSDPLRYKLKWNGEAFIEEPGNPQDVGFHISISRDGQAMLVVFVTRVEAMPGFCLISSKHY